MADQEGVFRYISDIGTSLRCMTRIIPQTKKDILTHSVSGLMVLDLDFCNVRNRNLLVYLPLQESNVT